MFMINQNTHIIGYVLGLPFLQAFTTVLDFDGKQIGFGNKKEGSAFIQGFTPILPPEPVPPIPDDDNTGD